MLIGITDPIYVTNDWHRKYMECTLKSIKSANHKLIFIPVENKIDDGMLPLEYPIDSSIEINRCDGKIEQSVASGWNIGIAEAIKLGCEYILVINTDILLKSNSIDHLIDFAEKHPEFIMWGMEAFVMDTEPTLASSAAMRMAGTKVRDNKIIYDALENKSIETENIRDGISGPVFLIKKDFVDKIGQFDENFTPAYFEDNDIHARIRISGNRAIIYGGAVFFHYGSETIYGNPEIIDDMARSYKLNKAYFKLKWGWEPIDRYHLSSEEEKEEDLVEVDCKDFYWTHPYNEEDKPITYWRKPKGRFM